MIKVCGITNLADALLAVEGGATAIGFNFYQHSKRYIPPEAAAQITAGLPASVARIGVFVNEAPAAIHRIAALAGLDVAQLHGEETAAAAPPGIRWWKAFRIDANFDAARLDEFPNAEAFLFDGPAGGEYGGSGKPFAWTIAAGMKHRIVIAGGLDATNVRGAIAQARPWGVDACSRLESSPGRKDRTRMLEFLKAALCEEPPD